MVDGLEGRKNLNYIAGDMFEAIPPADAVLLKVCISFSHRLSLPGSEKMRMIF